METPDFRAALADLIRQATTGPTAVMCSESVWWRCHRRLLADAVEVLWGVPVLHLFHDGRLVRHQPSPEARAAGDHLVYDVGSSEPLL
jgi:uncharacterized protein (DUF488 family)